MYLLSGTVLSFAGAALHRCCALISRFVVSKSFFYERSVRCFGRLNTCKFSRPLSIRQMLYLALDAPDYQHIPVDERSEIVAV